MAAFLGLSCLLAFFFVPEHAYNRPAIFDTDTSSQEDLSELDQHLESGWEALDEMKQPATSAQTETKKKFLEELSLYNGRFSSEPLYKSLLAPFVLFLYPATLWSFLFQRTFITSFILAQLFTGPPYNTQLGYMYAAPFIGAIVSYFAAGVFSDFLTKFMARRNNNIYEPELRILLVIPVAIVALPGIYAFGYTTEVAASSRLAS